MTETRANRLTFRAMTGMLSVVVASLALDGFLQAASFLPTISPVASSSSSYSTHNAFPSYNSTGLVSRSTSVISTYTTSNGTFNGYKVVHRKPVAEHRGGSGMPTSSLSCIGETFQEDSKDPWPAPWLYRTCHFKNLCFDMEEMDFVFIRSQEDKELDDALRGSDRNVNPLRTVSTSLSSLVDLGGGVAIGPISNRWSLKDKRRLKWFPKVIDEAAFVKETQNDGYYQLVGDTVVVPFHCMKGSNLGHTIWDSYLPIFHALSIFNLLPGIGENDRRLFLMRYVVSEKRPLVGSCEDPNYPCQALFEKTLPLMGINAPYEMRTSRDSKLELDDGNRPRSRYVCGNHAVAGLGLLSDHGMKLHGEWKSDYATMHNYGRGDTLLQFRNFLMSNIGLEPLASSSSSSKTKKSTHRLVFSIHSSGSRRRDTAFSHQILALKNHFADDDDIEILKYNLRERSLKEQIEILSGASILLTASGGGASTSLFLPYGASLIIFFDDDRSIDWFTGAVFTPSQRLDFDYFNNLGYVDTHWLPISTMDQPGDINILTKVVEKSLRDMTRTESLVS